MMQFIGSNLGSIKIENVYRVFSYQGFFQNFLETFSQKWCLKQNKHKSRSTNNLMDLNTFLWMWKEKDSDPRAKTI